MNLNKSLLAIVAVSALSVAQAAVVVGTDTTTTFSGTFSGILNDTGANTSALTTAPFAGVSGFSFSVVADSTATDYRFTLSGGGLGSEQILVADFDNFNSPSSDGNLTGSFSVTGYTVNYAYTFGGNYFADPGYSGTFSFTATPVPEPSEYAAIAGAGLIGFAAWRRSRKNLA